MIVSAITVTAARWRPGADMADAPFLGLGPEATAIAGHRGTPADVAAHPCGRRSTRR